jgi:peptidoglycan/xylan/chitin deacetylase (PgdA/CDA1 family)
MRARELLRGSWGGRLGGAAGALRLLTGGTLDTPGAIVFAYHDVGDDPANTTDYYVSPAMLRDQLSWGQAWGLRFVDLTTLTDAVQRGAGLDRLAAIVFDDSLVGVHHHAMPVLADMGLPATVFTVSAALGSSPPWWSGAARVMTRDELLELPSAGIRVQSHTRTHPSLPLLDDRGVQREIADSRAELEDLVQAPVDLFAYPFGHYDRRARAVVAESGYRAGYSFLNGRITAGLDRYRLPRLNMWPGQTRARLAYHLARPASSWPDHQLEVWDPPLPPSAVPGATDSPAR